MKLSYLSQKLAKPVAAKHRVPLIYIEKAKIGVKDNNIVLFQKDKETILPVASINGILLGVGTSISNEAVKIISHRNCCIIWCGGEGIPVHSYHGNYQSPKNIINQTKILIKDKLRLEKAKKLLHYRNHFLEENCPKLCLNEIKKCQNMDNLLLIEARWAKTMYAFYRNKYNIKNANELLKLTNYMCYGIITPIIVALGLNPNVGLMHGLNRGGGMVFDVADLIKPTCSVDVACKSLKLGYNTSQMKKEIIFAYEKNKYADKVINVMSDIWLT